MAKCLVCKGTKVDWTWCSLCRGDGKIGDKVCGSCGGSGKRMVTCTAC